MGSKKGRSASSDPKPVQPGVISHILSAAGLHRRRAAGERGFNVSKHDKIVWVYWHEDNTCDGWKERVCLALVDCAHRLIDRGYKITIDADKLIMEVSRHSPDRTVALGDRDILAMIEQVYHHLRRAVPSDASKDGLDWQCTVCGKGTHERHDPEKLCGKLEAIFRRSKTMMDPKRILR